MNKRLNRKQDKRPDRQLDRKLYNNSAGTIRNIVMETVVGTETGIDKRCTRLSGRIETELKQRPGRKVRQSLDTLTEAGQETWEYQESGQHSSPSFLSIRLGS